LTPIFGCAAKLPGESVVICCRQEEWRKTKSSYAGLLSGNVRIVHGQGEELDGYYQAADLFLFTLEPYEYMNLAMPYKIFEAVSYQVPILTFTGTEAARWIHEEGAGWTVRDIADLIALIGRLRDYPGLIAEKRVHLRELARKHSWTNRALSVAAALGVEKGAR
jgi:glycosyltransferase involved in cell wall biosynthesis